MKDTKNVSQILIPTIRASKSKVKASKMLLIAIISMITLASCEKSSVTTTTRGGLTLSYTIDDSFLDNSKAHTRTAASSSENVISELALIFYSRVGTAECAGYTVLPLNSSSSSGTIQITTPNLVEGDYDVILLCNFHNYTPNNGSDAQSTRAYLESIKTMNFVDAKAAIHFVAHRAIRGQLPMYTIGIYTQPPSPVQADIFMSATLQRAVLRVDVYDYDNNFKLESAKLYNYNTELYPFAAAQKSEAMNSAIDAGFSGVGSNSSSNIIGGLYCFPNSVELPRQADVVTTYLMVKGKYQTVGSSTFYRVNILNDNDKFSQSLVMNTLYSVNIFDATSSGAASESVAKDAATALIRTSMSDETLEETITDMSSNYIYISSSRVVLGSGANSEKPVTISVNPLKAWSANIASGGDFFNIIPSPSTDRLTIRATGTANPAVAKKGVVRVTHPSNSALFVDIDIIQ